MERYAPIMRHDSGVDLGLLVQAVAERSPRWEEAGISWQLVHNDGQPKLSVLLRAETPTRIAELIVWMSGEADLIHAELEPQVTDPITDHYELTALVGLNGCLDDFEECMGLQP